MPRYMIDASHKPEECLKVLDAFLQAGAHYLTRAEWGCEDDVHTGWIVVEAENADAARLLVPPVIRSSIRPVLLNHFSPSQIRHFHVDAEARMLE